MIKSAAPRRQESRGSHYREDCARHDDAQWGISILSQEINDVLDQTTVWLVDLPGN